MYHMDVTNQSEDQCCGIESECDTEVEDEVTILKRRALKNSRILPKLQLIKFCHISLTSIRSY